MIGSLLDFFLLAMARNDQQFMPLKGDRNLNLGAGNKSFSWARSLQLPEWNAEIDQIPEEDASIDNIVAFHFLEHISPNKIPLVLSDCIRVMKAGATLNIAVPHRLGGIAYQDLDHKTFFTENTWRILMQNDYYKTGWNVPLDILRVNLNLIIGDSERTLMLFTQFIKAN